MNKLTLILCLGLMLVSSNAFAQQADSYDILIGLSDDVFSYTAPLAGLVIFRSPLRNGDGTDNFALVNSKYAQPRTTGTNPHIGVDLQAAAETAVFPVRGGKVYAVDLRPSDQDGIGRVTIQFDTNGDGNYDTFPFPNDNLFVTYLHMKEISVNVGGIVTISDTVGLVSNVGASVVHLHWEINTITGTSNCKSNFREPGCTAVRTSLYYIGLSGTQWNGGRDLDFITDIAWVNGRRAEGYVYTMDDGV